MKHTYSHIYLYAKYWYEREDAEEDLRRILSVRNGIEPQWITTIDIAETMLILAYESINTSGNPQREFIAFALTVQRNQDVIKSALPYLCCRKMTDDFDLAEPDYTILPERTKPIW